MNSPEIIIENRIKQDYKLYVLDFDTRTASAIEQELSRELRGLFNIHEVKGGADASGTYLHVFGELIADSYGGVADVYEIEIEEQIKMIISKIIDDAI